MLRVTNSSGTCKHRKPAYRQHESSARTGRSRACRQPSTASIQTPHESPDRPIRVTARNRLARAALRLHRATHLHPPVAPSALAAGLSSVVLSQCGIRDRLLKPIDPAPARQRGGGPGRSRTKQATARPRVSCLAPPPCRRLRRCACAPPELQQALRRQVVSHATAFPGRARRPARATLRPWRAAGRLSRRVQIAPPSGSA